MFYKYIKNFRLSLSPEPNLEWKIEKFFSGTSAAVDGKVPVHDSECPGQNWNFLNFGRGSTERDVQLFRPSDDGLEENSGEFIKWIWIYSLRVFSNLPKSMLRVVIGEGRRQGSGNRLQTFLNFSLQ